jgi:hypothetical protein
LIGVSVCKTNIHVQEALFYLHEQTADRRSIAFFGRIEKRAFGRRDHIIGANVNGWRASGRECVITRTRTGARLFA